MHTPHRTSPWCPMMPEAPRLETLDIDLLGRSSTVPPNRANTSDAQYIYIHIYPSHSWFEDWVHHSDRVRGGFDRLRYSTAKKKSYLATTPCILVSANLPGVFVLHDFFLGMDAVTIHYHVHCFWEARDASTFSYAMLAQTVPLRLR